MLRPRIAVLVSGGGTNLQALIDAMKEGRITNGRIAVVVASREGIYALHRAEANHIDHTVISRKMFQSQKEFNDALLACFAKYEIGLVVLAGYLNILSPEITGQYPNKIINVHPSLIPSFCGEGHYGLKVHEMALNYGVKVTGATVHFVNEVTDGGAVILQKAVEVRLGDTPEILQKRVMEEAEWIILPQAVDLFCNEKIEVIGRKAFIKA
ncbi:Phosphoribosylglycinamide formyltransferase [bioreactor metagenome]|uniref:phosphoribosylglycinamide formyltransferase 1 n=1 Tax=bioreactor metagenome TaxID=1076179 RepID=A0A645DHC2_9ZZZZ